MEKEGLARISLVGAAAAILSSLLFSGKGILIKLAYADGASVDQLMVLRQICGLPVFLAVFLFLEVKARRGTGQALDFRAAVMVSLCGFLGYFLSSYLDFMGLQTITAGLERQVLYLYPTLVLLFTMVRDRKAPSAAAGVALLVSYAGIALCFGGEWRHSGGAGLVWGVSLVFAAAIAYAVFTVLGESWNKKLGSMRFLSLAYMAGTGFLLGMTAFSGFDPSAVTRHYLAYGLALAMACTIVPIFLFGFALSRIGGVHASILSALGPVLTLILANRFLAEPAGGMQWSGLLLVIAGALILTFGKGGGSGVLAKALRRLRHGARPLNAADEAAVAAAAVVAANAGSEVKSGSGAS